MAPAYSSPTGRAALAAVLAAGVAILDASLRRQAEFPEGAGWPGCNGSSECADPGAAQAESLSVSMLQSPSTIHFARTERRRRGQRRTGQLQARHAAPAEAAAGKAVDEPGPANATGRKAGGGHQYFHNMRRGSRGYGHALMMRVAESLVGRTRTAEAAAGQAVDEPGQAKVEGRKPAGGHKYFHNMRRGSRGYGHALMMRVAEFLVGKTQPAEAAAAAAGQAVDEPGPAKVEGRKPSKPPA